MRKIILSMVIIVLVLFSLIGCAYQPPEEKNAFAGEAIGSVSSGGVPGSPGSILSKEGVLFYNDEKFDGVVVERNVFIKDQETGNLVRLGDFLKEKGYTFQIKDIVIHEDVWKFSADDDNIKVEEITGPSLYPNPE